jgi:hypothetical protein
MRCITSDEAVALFGRAGFSVAPNLPLHRVTLQLKSEIADGQNRLGGRPTPNITRLTYFAEAMNRWHPPKLHRLLWVDHAAFLFPSAHALFMAARIGLGETRSLLEAPGHFDPYPYDERDQTKISPQQAKETGILIGLMSLIMIESWDGWLIADGSSDRIEFWEGNIFFYSDKRSRLTDASSLMKDFDCSLELV